MVTSVESSSLEPQLMAVASVIELCRGNDLGSREKSLCLPDRHESDTKLECGSRTEDEPARLDSGDLRSTDAERLDERDREFA